MVNADNEDTAMIVRTLYDEYVSMVYTQPGPLPDEQEMQIQAAFYAGVFGILAYLEKNADNASMEVTGKDIDMMESLYAELQQQRRVIVGRMKTYWPGASR